MSVWIVTVWDTKWVLLYNRWMFKATDMSAIVIFAKSIHLNISVKTLGIRPNGIFLLRRQVVCKNLPNLWLLSVFVIISSKRSPSTA